MTGLEMSNKETFVDYENYNKTSNDYDQAGRTPVCADKIIEKIPQDAVILDAGCGTGNYMQAILKSDKVKIYKGIDGNDGMLEQIRKKIKKFDNDAVNVSVEKCNLIRCLPFADSTYDMVMINQVLHHLIDDQNEDKYIHIRTLFKECYRILKPNGILSINTCLPDQAVRIWFVQMLPMALERNLQIYPSLEVFQQLTKQVGFSDLTFVRDPVPYLGENYWSYELAFDEKFQHGDSTWAMAPKDVIKDVLKQLKIQLDGNRNEFDKKVREDNQKYGQTTQIFCKK